MIPDGYPSGIIGKSTGYHEKKMKILCRFERGFMGGSKPPPPPPFIFIKKKQKKTPL